MKPYMVYSIERREAAKKAHPELSLSEVSGLLGRTWKAFTPEEKQPWIEKALAYKAESEGHMDAQNRYYPHLTTNELQGVWNYITGPIASGEHVSNASTDHYLDRSRIHPQLEPYLAERCLNPTDDMSRRLFRSY